MNLSNVNLTLFFTGGVGIKTWADVGNLKREIAIYQRLSSQLKSVNFITYGGHEDEQYADQVGNIGVYPINWNKHTVSNIISLLYQHPTIIKRSSILKTNQIKGVEIPLRLKKLFGKKLIVRCGYLLSRIAVNSGGEVVNPDYAHKLEKYAFENADAGVVTTEFNRRYLINNYNIKSDKIRVIPNYVDTDIFSPKANSFKEFDIAFVGREGKEKNLRSLLDATIILKKKGMDLKLLFIGGCSSDETLNTMTHRSGIKAVFAGNVRNDLLPEMLNKAKVFILPSLYEGHPKALIEAMSCGLPCIGTEVEGIKELIQHMETGYLCRTDSESLAEAIEVMLSGTVLRKRLGDNARHYVVKNFSIDRIVDMEIDLIREIMSDRD